MCVRAAPTSQTQFYNLPNESFTNLGQSQQVYTNQTQIPIEQLQTVFQAQHDMQQVQQLHLAQQTVQPLQQQLLPQQAQLLQQQQQQQQFQFNDPNQIRGQQQNVLGNSFPTLASQTPASAVMLGQQSIGTALHQQVINIQNVPCSSNSAENSQLQQQQQQLFQQQQQQQQQHNQNVIVSHTSNTVQGQPLSALDPHQSVIQQSGSYAAAVHPTGSPAVVSAPTNNQAVPQTTMLQQNHLIPQQQVRRNTEQCLLLEHC